MQYQYIYNHSIELRERKIKGQKKKPNLDQYAYINLSITIPLTQPTKQGNTNLQINANITTNKKTKYEKLNLELVSRHQCIYNFSTKKINQNGKTNKQKYKKNNLF